MPSEDPDIKASQFGLLSEGWSNLPNGVLDTRIPGAGTLAGPFPLQGPNISEHDYAGDIIHRFFRLEQQDCSVASATKDNTSGCKADRFRSRRYATDQSLGNPMGFYNADQDQVPYLKGARRPLYAERQFPSVVPRRYLREPHDVVTGDARYWSDANGNPITPDTSQIANPIRLRNRTSNGR